MHRFYLPPDQCRGEVLTLSNGEAHHASRVLRVREGERVTVLDGAGQELQCEIAGPVGKTVSLKVIQRRSASPLDFSITLIQAIPKAKIIEDIIQKATELGAARVVPILSERVVTHLEGEDAKAKAEKWQHVAVEAMKQCGNPWLPKVDAPLSLKAFLARAEKFELAVVGCLLQGSSHPRHWIEKFRAEHQRIPKSIGVWVGPEGDFSNDEYEAIARSGALPITLGPLVLRVETAAIYCLSVMNYEMRSPNGVRTALSA
jgi:16S rRNA (uracil1498-N3)-methyltransferase